MKNLLKRVKKVVLTLLFFLVLVSVLRGISRLVFSGDRVKSSQAKLEELKVEQERLKYELGQISSDFYREKLARDKLGLAKEGEKVVVLPSEEILRRLSPRKLELEKTDSQEPNWKKWAKLFF